MSHKPAFFIEIHPQIPAIIALRFAFPAIPNNQCSEGLAPPPAFPALTARKKRVFLVNFERGGVPPNRLTAVLERKFADNFGNFFENLWDRRCEMALGKLGVVMVRRRRGSWRVA
jgi:hypothetical protein